MIVVGQSLGGVAGASLAALLFHNLKSPYELMLFDGHRAPGLDRYRLHSGSQRDSARRRGSGPRGKSAARGRGWVSTAVS